MYNATHHVCSGWQHRHASFLFRLAASSRIVFFQARILQFEARAVFVQVSSHAIMSRIVFAQVGSICTRGACSCLQSLLAAVSLILLVQVSSNDLISLSCLSRFATSSRRIVLAQIGSIFTHRSLQGSL